MLYQAGGSMRNKMLDTNPWLNSRFSHFIEFGDWGLEDCLHLFHKRAATGNFTLQEAAELELKTAFRRCYPWMAAARDVDKVWKASLQDSGLVSQDSKMAPTFAPWIVELVPVHGTGRTRAWLKDAQKASDFVHSRSSE